MTMNERRAEIMRILTARRSITMPELARTFQVTTRTIQNDVVALTVDYPLETQQGKGGCVKVAQWYHPHRNILSGEQQRVLAEIICRTFNLKGKAFCASRQIQEDILLPIVQEVYDNGAEVERILVQPDNVLEFILEDGNVITRTWKAHSRRESWTPEKREQARQKMMRYHSERRACANE